MADINHHLTAVALDEEVKGFVRAGLEDMRDTVMAEYRDADGMANINPVWYYVKRVQVQDNKVFIEDEHGQLHGYRVIVEKL